MPDFAKPPFVPLQTPRSLKPLPRPVVRKKSVALSALIRSEQRFKPDLFVKLPFISTINLDQIADVRTLIVKSPIGTGKTRLAAHLIRRAGQRLERLPRVLVLTHRQALAKDLTQRLGNDLAEMSFENYQGLTGADLRQIDRLTLCVNSVHKLTQVDQSLPRYDLILIDEIEQFLAHLDGGTFEGGEALYAYTCLRRLIKAAGQVLVMDADAGPTSRGWLEWLRGSTFTVVNRYVRDRKGMTLYTRQDRLVEASYPLIEANEGPVVIATSSRKIAKKMALHFSQACGQEFVYMLCSENSSTERAQAFIEAIETELPKLKVFIYTPSLGTGVDIQVAVRGMFGIFRTEPLASSELYQMLGRCRNVQETHVYVERMARTFATDPDVIYRRYLRNAVETGKQCKFNAHGILEATLKQRRLLNLLSIIQAQRNRSMNYLYDHFRSGAAGYQLKVVDEKPSEAVTKALRKAHQWMMDEYKLAVLTARSIDDVEYEQTYSKTEEIEAGHERYQLETLVGQALTESIYVRFRTEAMREQLRRYTDLIDDLSVLERLDRQEIIDRTLMNKRQNLVVHRQVILEVLTTLFGEDWQTNPTRRTEPEIEPPIKACLKRHESTLKNLFGQRVHQQVKKRTVLRRLLRSVGLRLDYKQVTRDGKRSYVYTLDPEDLQSMQGYALSRLSNLQNTRVTR